MSDNIFIVDSHCHLNYEGLRDRVPEVISAAHEAGVKVMQSICTRLSEFDDIYKIAEENLSVWASVGIHPHDSDKHCQDHSETPESTRKVAPQPVLTNDELLAQLLEYASRPKTIGIGETGLDYYYQHSNREKQRQSFIIHLEAASQSGLPVIIHTRDAEEDTYNILKDFMSKKPLKGLLHCFTGTADMAKKCMELGFYVSISGIVTFKNAGDLRDVVKNIVPMDRLLVETDSPFLAPIPFRGKPCEPAYTRITAEFISELKGIPLEELANKTTENFLKLFDKVKL